MSTDADAELARVREKFAPMDLRSLAGWAVLLIAMLVAAQFKHVDWFLVAGMLSVPVTWEVTKHRLRRHTEEFARAAR